MLTFTKQQFVLPFEETSISGDQILSESPLQLLCLHGAGPTTTRILYDEFRHWLFTRGTSSTAFDFIGHGESQGNLKKSSLYHRFQQICFVIDSLRLPQPLSICADSMSGYTAIRLVEKYEVQNLILIVPAVYHQEAYKLPFDQGFTELIRQPKSWLHTDAWKILQAFKGRLMIIQAEEDQVIPHEIIHRLYDAASNVAYKEHYLIPKCPHKMRDFFKENPLEDERLNMACLRFLQRESVS